MKFRERMIAHNLDQKLLDRTVALAKQTGRFGWQALRAALDSSPLVGAGRVEDTWKLLGRALGTVVTCAAATLKMPRAHVLQGAGVTLLGAKSLKAALDIDWSDPAAQADALARLLAEVDRVEAWVATHVPVAEAPPVQAALGALRRVLAQDLSRQSLAQYQRRALSQAGLYDRPPRRARRLSGPAGGSDPRRRDHGPVSRGGLSGLRATLGMLDRDARGALTRHPSAGSLPTNASGTPTRA